MIEGFVKELGCDVCECIDCGCLVPGGPTRCKRCAREYGRKVRGWGDAAWILVWRTPLKRLRALRHWSTAAWCNGDTAKKYNELLYAVARKYTGETRHETALRYIREAESRSGGWDSVKQNAEGQHHE